MSFSALYGDNLVGNILIFTVILERKALYIYFVIAILEKNKRHSNNEFH